jgi:peptidoglycan/xylan/chitin deacetylase (PgdA/CDA1 family)
MFMSDHRAGVRILNYHAVIRQSLSFPDWCFLSEEMFHEQMQYIKSNFDVLPMTVALERLRKGNLSNPTVVITFDDGFMNNFEIAYPILKEGNLPATLFLTTALIGTANTLWPCQVIHALEMTRLKEFEWSGKMFNLAGPGRRAHASDQIQRKLKLLPQPDLLVALEKILKALGQENVDRVARSSAFRILDESAIQTMLAEGLIELGAHTESHAILSLLTASQKHTQIHNSVKEVARLSGKPCTLFAYPNGRRQDYDVESMEILNTAGVKYAVTTTEGSNESVDQPLELKRIGIGSDMEMKDFKIALTNLD